MNLFSFQQDETKDKRLEMRGEANGGLILILLQNTWNSSEI